VETTFSGSDIPDGVIADPEYKSARPIIEVSGAKNTEIKPGSVKEYDDGSESVYTETINNVDYEQLRIEGLGFQAGGWELYKTRNPILTSPDKTENIQNSDIARNIQTENIKEVIDTQFVDKNGWKVGRQSLWGAETRYASGLAIWSYPGWENKNISESQVYNDNDPTDHDQAWSISNAGEINSLVYSKSNNRESVFEGGFAAKCDEGQQWQYRRGEWRCSGDLNWQQLVSLPRVSSNDIIGLQIPAVNFMDQSQLENALGEDYERFRSYPIALTGKTSLYGDSMDEVDATCWVGEIEDKDTAAPNETASATFSVSDSETTGFFAEVDHSGTYSCEWTYTTSSGKTWNEGAEGSMIEMHNLHPIYDSDKTEYTITRNVRLNSESLEYSYNSADQFKNKNPSLTEVPNE